MVIVDPDMYHDAVLLVVSSLVSAFLFLRLHARFSVSPVCAADADTSVSPDVSSQDSLSKSVQWRSKSIGNSMSIGRHPRATSGAAFFGEVFVMLSTRLGTWIYLV